jgi:hypothetical protein
LARAQTTPLCPAAASSRRSSSWKTVTARVFHLTDNYCLWLELPESELIVPRIFLNWAVASSYLKGMKNVTLAHHSGSAGTAPIRAATLMKHTCKRKRLEVNLNPTLTLQKQPAVPLAVSLARCTSSTTNASLNCPGITWLQLDPHTHNTHKAYSSIQPEALAESAKWP